MNCNKLTLLNDNGTVHTIFEVGGFYENNQTTIIDSIYLETYSNHSGSRIVLQVGNFSKPAKEKDSTNYIKIGTGKYIDESLIDITEHELFYSGCVLAKTR